MGWVDWHGHRWVVAYCLQAVHLQGGLLIGEPRCKGPAPPSNGHNWGEWAYSCARMCARMCACMLMYAWVFFFAHVLSIMHVCVCPCTSVRTCSHMYICVHARGYHALQVHGRCTLGWMPCRATCCSFSSWCSSCNTWCSLAAHNVYRGGHG